MGGADIVDVRGEDGVADVIARRRTLQDGKTILEEHRPVSHRQE